MCVKAMPEIRIGERVPSPVRGLKILKDDAGLGILLRSIAPHVKVTLWRAGGSSPGALKPRMLIRRVIDDQFGNYPNATTMSRLQERLKIGELPVARVNARVVGDVIAVIAQG